LDTTWEKVDEFKKAYPEVQLGDELFLGEEGNVIDSFVGKVYHRRRQVQN
jgi:transcriptional regulator GlxA family with amidase domain